MTTIRYGIKTGSLAKGRKRSKREAADLSQRDGVVGARNRIHSFRSRIWSNKNNIVNSYNQPDAVNSIDYTRRNFHQTITKDTKELIKIRKEHPSFRLKTSEEIANNVSFETIENQVLVYKTNKDNDRNYVFFNPTSNSFQYFMNEKGKSSSIMEIQTIHTTKT